MAKVLAAAEAFALNEEGAAVIEYAVALILIAIVTLAALTALGANFSAFFDAAATTI